MPPSSVLRWLSPTALGAIIAVTATGGGCLLDAEDVPEGVRLSCVSAADCPDGFACVEDLGECVRRAGATVDVAGAPAVDPEVAKVGTTVRVSFTVEGELLRDSEPEVTIDIGASRTARFERESADGSSYVFAYTPDGSETEGERSISALLRAADDTPAQVTLGSVVLDFSPPRLEGVVTASHTHASASTPVTFTFALTEPVPSPPAIELTDAAGADATADDATADADAWSVAVGTADADDGAWNVRARATDAAGNEALLALGAVVIDRVAPSVVGFETADAPLSAFQEIGAVITLDEPWAEVSGAVARTAAGAEIALTPAGAGVTLSAFGLTSPGDDGVYEIEIASIVDVAGNTTTDVSAGTVTVDTTPPQVATVTVLPDRPSFGPADELIVVVTADEELAAPPELNLLADGAATAFTPVDGAANPTFTLDLSTLSVIGVFPIRVGLTDLAGNFASSDVALVDIDTRAPVLLDAELTPADATLGDSVILRLTFDEGVEDVAPAALSFSDGASGALDGASLGFVHAGTVGTSQLFRLDVNGTTSVADWQLTGVIATDLVGNTSAAMAPPLATVLRVDTTAPVVSAIGVDTNVTDGAPATVGAGQIATLSFTVDAAPASLEVLAAGCRATVQLPKDAAPPTPTCGLSCGAYVDPSTPVSCGYTAQGDEVTAGTTGAGIVLVEALDAAGNAGTASGAIVFDLEPPSVVAGSTVLRVAPPPGSPLADPGANATNGSTVSVQLLLSEPIAATGTTGLSLNLGTSPDIGLTFTGSVTAAGAAGFEGVVGGQVSDVDSVDVELLSGADLSDLYGNAVAASVPLGTLRLDVTPPSAAALVDPAEVKQLRIPWGAEQNGYRPAQYLVAAAFSDEPIALPDCPGGPACLDKTVFDPLSASSDGTRQIQRVLVHTADVGLGGQRVGVLEPFHHETQPGWEAVELFASDSDELWVSLVDAAGNESPDRVRVTEVEWVATLGGKVAGSFVENPHDFQTRHLASGQRVVKPGEHFGTDHPDGTGVATSDGALVSTSSRGRFLRAAPPEDPARRAEASLAWVDRGGYALLFGGWGPTGVDTYHDDTYQYVDGRWREVHTADLEGDGDPNRRYAAAVAYDSLRDVVVVIGGDTLAKFDNDVWEWDGLSWRNVPPLDPEGDGNPLGRLWSAAAFDPIRGVTIMFGGSGNNDWLGGTWAWDGLSWELIIPDDPTLTTAPGLRERHMMTWDPDREAVVLFGGREDTNGASNDTWLLDANGWTELTIVDDLGDGMPSTRIGGSLAFDGARRNIVLFGGSNTLNDTWVLEGNEWRLAQANATGSPDQPSRRDGASMIFAPLRDAIVLYGGTAGFNNWQGDTWEWDGAGWSRRPLPDVDGDGEPTEQAGAFSMGYDPQRGRTAMLADGHAPSMWEWDGATWKLVAPDDTAADGDPAVSARSLGLAWDPARQQLLAYSGEVYGWDGVSWTHYPLTDDLAPRPTASQSRIAYDTTRARLVLVTRTGVVWEWDGATNAWAQPTIVDNLGDGSPGSSDGGGFDAVWDPTSQRVLMLASGYNDPLPDATWAWDGSEWEKLVASDPENDGNPGNVNSFAAAHDAHRGTVIVHGGFSDDYIVNEELWEWTGSSWRRLALADPESDGNPLRREDHRMAYDAARRRMVVYGGNSDPNDPDLADTWELSFDTSDRPGHALHFALDTTGFTPAGITALEVRAVAGGQSWVADASAPGASLLLWTPAGWVATDSNAAAEDAAGALTTSATPAVADEVLTSLLAGDDLSVLVAPIGGASPGDAVVSTDYVEARVRYRHPAL
jgi:hypothetical protein